MWMRNINGLSNDEKSLMLMQEFSFKELQNETKHRDLINNLIKLEGKKLFLNAERKLGVSAFQDTLFAHIKANAFQNLSFEALLDTLGEIADTDFRVQLQEWNQPAELTEFMIGTPTVTRIETELMEIYQAEIIIANLSDKAGSVNMKLQFWSQGGSNDYQIFDGEEKPTEWIIDKDLRVDTYRSSGAGGQHVNKTDSAIRMTHLPTGIVVTCQDERSQLKNREKAMMILKAKLYDYYQGQKNKEYADNRKAQVGTGDRSERIRTYNFPQGRITDHRIGFTAYNLLDFMNGAIDELVAELQMDDQKRRLESLDNQ